MTDVNIKAAKNGAVYNVPIEIGPNYFVAKFDTGAGVTVISSGLFLDDKSGEALEKLEDYFKSRGCCGREFVSASGDTMFGYKIHANDVMIDNTNFSDFYYYFILNSKRAIALLGDDFIECCYFSHIPHEGIDISKFDFEDYGTMEENDIRNDELIEFIDSLAL